MNTRLTTLLAVAGLTCAVQAAAQATFYETADFAGRSLTATEQVPSFGRYGFNNSTSSAVVVGERWEVCQQEAFSGRCTVLRPGRYPSLAAMGLNDRISSARVISQNTRVDDNRYAPGIAAAVVPQVTFYERENFAGRTFSSTEQVANLRRQGFSERAASAVVVGERWEVCEDNRFRGTCTVLRPGHYPSLAAMGLNDRVSSVRAIAPNARVADNRYAPTAVSPQVTFFERENFGGRSFATEATVISFQNAGFNDRASSAVVVGERWEVCNDTRFRGGCVVLRPGRYPSLAAIGLNDRISSVRAIAPGDRIADNRYAPLTEPVYDSRRRGGERLFEANVTSARAVLATSGQRCWVEREQVPQVQSNTNVPAALAGALIGGILGHQVGGGSGKDIATVGGVIAGAALGANMGRDNPAATQDVQRCENVPGGAQPAFWDVSYNFRGQDHRVQMTSAPGATIVVNDQGEPRQ